MTGNKEQQQTKTTVRARATNGDMKQHPKENNKTRTSYKRVKEPT